MNITSDPLRGAITHIERLASHDGRMFEVYLFELKAVTVAATQGIVRAFRNRPGDYLLVLVDSNERYERLDFVLVERYTADTGGTQSIVPDLPSPAQKQVGVRPRVLTVHRRNPDKVALRVLRRFSTDSFKPLEQTQQSEKRSLCFLDTLLNESERYARELGERLKERVFDDIFPHFARGFVLHARRTEQLPAHIEDLPAVERNRLLEPYFNGTLTFLYRLLFLLYAESRDLLPVRREMQPSMSPSTMAASS